MESYLTNPGSVQKGRENRRSASHHSPDEDKKSHHIISHFEIPAPYHRLKGTNRTGANSTGTGITVQARNTGIFQFACVNLPVTKPVTWLFVMNAHSAWIPWRGHSLIFIFFVFCFLLLLLSLFFLLLMIIYFLPIHIFHRLILWQCFRLNHPIPTHSIQILMAFVNTTASSPRKIPYPIKQVPQA